MASPIGLPSGRACERLDGPGTFGSDRWESETVRLPSKSVYAVR
jgi:hypothetical protein